MNFKITYSTPLDNLEMFHQEFDNALVKIRDELKKCKFEKEDVIESRNPSDGRELLGTFKKTDVSRLDDLFVKARAAQTTWTKCPWQERVALMNRTAEHISAQKFLLAAKVSLEAGKNRLEAMGEVEEAADLLRYYAQQLVEADGFIKPMLRLNPKEDTRSILRPYGTFVVIAPFNFPFALAAGMTAGALLGGNSVILKPSDKTPWSAALLLDIFTLGGMPENLIQVVQGDGRLGAALVEHPQTDGVAFTGSKKIGMQIMATMNRDFAKPCLLELGGKNAAVVCATAHLEDAAEGCVRSAFGYSGQKCSALSRIYVHTSCKSEFLKLLKEKTAALKIGLATERETFLGPVIGRETVERFKNIRAAETLLCDETVFGRDDLKHGFFVPPIIAELPHQHELMHEELFLPFVGVDTFDDFQEVLLRVNDSEYGLTGGIYSQDSQELEMFFDQVKAGILYANRRSGATTGAWPGVQPFCGWKGSGSTGKGGCGPYYVMQFMREQSWTRVVG